MNILENSMEIEREGKEYYLSLAARTPLPEIAGIFNFLAGEEQKHFDQFSALSKKVRPDPLPDSSALEVAQEVFSKMTASFSVKEPLEDYVSAYQKAKGFEQKSIEYYQQALAQKLESDQQAVFTFILKQEQVHLQLMTNMIEFVRRPKEWLENAEWNHLDEY
ncbi:MAG: ferritin family protein [Chitinivibrionales bacterium]|nr:ferritin family protein [Chitinivibrionales bacterium]